MATNACTPASEKPVYKNNLKQAKLQIIQALVDHGSELDISGNERIALQVLANWQQWSCSKGEGIVYATADRLAKQTGVSVSTWKRITNTLEEKGLIKKAEYSRKGAYTRVSYDITGTIRWAEQYCVNTISFTNSGQDNVIQHPSSNQDDTGHGGQNEPRPTGVKMSYKEEIDTSKPEIEGKQNAYTGGGRYLATIEHEQNTVSPPLYDSFDSASKRWSADELEQIEEVKSFVRDTLRRNRYKNAKHPNRVWKFERDDNEYIAQLLYENGYGADEVIDMAVVFYFYPETAAIEESHTSYDFFCNSPATFFKILQEPQRIMNSDAMRWLKAQGGNWQGILEAIESGLTKTSDCL